jgi:mono/diheme cytochrome c family protein
MNRTGTVGRSPRFTAGLIASAIALGAATGTRVRAEDEIDRSLSEAGKIWYEKYCTQCHGPGGAPGKAVYSEGKQPVDLRAYVQRHGGKFPAADWLAVIADARPGGVHAPVWAKIREDQVAGTAGSTAAARGILAQIARYVVSIQSK